MKLGRQLGHGDVEGEDEDGGDEGVGGHARQHVEGREGGGRHPRRNLPDDGQVEALVQAGEVGDDGGHDDDDELNGDRHLQLVFVALVHPDLDGQQNGHADQAHDDVSWVGVGDVLEDVDVGQNQLAHSGTARQLQVQHLHHLGPQRPAWNQGLKDSYSLHPLQGMEG